MPERRLDLAWQLTCALLADVLNPLLILSTALFVSLGYILTLLMPVEIGHWAALWLLSLLVPLAWLLRRMRTRWRKGRYRLEPFAWRCLLPGIAALLVMPCQVTLLALPSLESFSHTDMHFAYITQITNLPTPVESIYAAGYPASYYWLYHALVAAVIRVTSLDMYSAFIVVNAVFMLSALHWFGQILVWLGLGKARSLRLALLIVFFLCSLNLTSLFTLLDSALQGTLDLGWSGATLLPNADRRLSSTLIRLSHASGVTPAYAAFAAALYACLRILKGKLHIAELTLVSACGIAILGIMPMLIITILPTLLGALGLVALVEWRSGGERKTKLTDGWHWLCQSIAPAQLALWLLLSLALSLPLVAYTLDFTGNYRGGVEFLLFNELNMGMTVAAQLLLLPLGLALAVMALRERRRVHVFVCMSIVIVGALQLGILLPDFNQYKQQYMLSILLSLAALVVLAQLQQSQSALWRRLSRLCLDAMILLALGNLLYGQYMVTERALKYYTGERFVGMNVGSMKHEKFSGWLLGLYWIRDNTPVNAVTILKQKAHSDAFMLHGRATFVRPDGYYFNDDFAVHALRSQQLQAFFADETPLADYRDFLASIEAELPGRPFYAIVDEDDVPIEMMSERGAQLVYRQTTEDDHVYLLNPAVLE